MSNLVNNSSTVPLSANGVFRGQTVKVDQQFMTCTVNVDTDVSGTLTFNHSQDGFNFYTLGDSFVVNGQTHKEVILKGLYFYVKYTNGSDAQTLFNLFTKTSLNVRDQNASGGGAGGDVNITGCEVTIPVSGTVTCDISGQTVDISGQTVVVSGVATEATLLDTYNLLNDNTSTGGVNVSLTALDGEKITNTVVDTKRGLDCNIINNSLACDISGQTVDISGQTVVVDISGQTVDVSGQTVVVDISGQTVDISGQTVVCDISGQTVVVDISGQTVVVDISGQTVDISGQTVVINDVVPVKVEVTNAVNDLNVNILTTNSTIYDLTNDAPTMTENDSRFSADRVRPDSWAFVNDKNQNGSNIYWYSNSSTSPLGVQEFDILHGDISSLYCVVSINKTENSNRLPFLALFSPSEVAFYNSRWIYQIKGDEQIVQTEKVLLYWNNNPVSIYPNLRHIEMVKNVIASQGPQLETEKVFLMSINTASAEPASSISYNAYNAGWVLNNGVHNDYAFNSGIQSKGDLNLSKLTFENNLLAVNVSNIATVGVLNSSFTVVGTDSYLNTNVKGEVDVSGITFGDIDSVNTKGLNVITRNVYTPSIINFTQANVNSITRKSDSIDLRGFNLINIIASESHTGGGSHNINVEYSTDGITWFTSPHVISGTATAFSWDYSGFCVPYMRLSFNVSILTLNCFICLK